MALPREVGMLAETYYRQTTAHAGSTTDALLSLWQSIPDDMSILEGWDRVREPMVAVMAQSQVESALMASAYLQAQGMAQGVNVAVANPSAFVTPTDVSSYWLSYGAAHTVRAANTGGIAEVYARRAGSHILARTIGSMVTDAGREAEYAGMVATPEMVGYYRKLSGTACDRCAILAGAYYRWSDGFLRHPRCQCRHVPAAEQDDSLAFDALEALRNNKIGTYRTLPDGSKVFEPSLSEADRKAILEDGADMGRVINAKRRGLRVSDIYGDRVRHTVVGPRPGMNLRLRPSEIYRQAGMDRDLARRLLQRHGYVSL